MSKQQEFIHLRNSSEYSISRGLSKIKDIVDTAKSHGMPAIALTDFGNLFGLVKFFSYAESQGIKPIIGTVMYVKDSFTEDISEALFIAKNNDGLSDLVNLISASQHQIISHCNYVTFDQISQDAENKFVILGGKRSELFKFVSQNKNKYAENLIHEYKNIFKENLLVEFQFFENELENSISKKVVNLASKLCVPVIATNDCMFCKKEDFDIHEIKVCINSKTSINDSNREKLFSQEQFIKSSKEMEALFSKQFKMALKNTFEVAKSCNVSLSTGEYFLPEYPVPSGESFDSFLEKQAFKGLEAIVKDFNKDQQNEYIERLKYEISEIKKTGFSSYFLIVADFILWSKSNDIPVGPGRGSGAGSLVAFALGITELDPIEHNLLFERFINPERISMPDFDIDFCMDKRDKVINYVSEKYGGDAVSQIVTFGTMAARAVVRDVARAIGKPYSLGDRIANMIPTTPGVTLKQSIDSQPLFKKMINDEDEVSEIIDISFKLEGIVRNVGKHAGGIVIAPGKITDFCPIYIDQESNSSMTQLDKDDIETIGLVKFDFLGLRTLTVIDNTLEQINKFYETKYGKKLDLQEIDLSDPSVYELLSRGDTLAVFQLESPGMRELIRRLKPTKFEEIVALLALYRPGPLKSKMDDEFVNRKHNKVKVTFPHAMLEPVLEETYGVILYQEQVMKAAQVLANYTLGEADILRRAMGKKKKDEMSLQREVFVRGCNNNKIKKPVAEKIFDLIEKFAEYGFNKSHSAAYALISFQTAFLKTHYPAYFMAGVLTSELGNTDKIQILIKECRSMGLEVLSPNVNTSKKHFIVNDAGKIEYGLGAIKGVADSYLDSLIENQKNNYKDLFDLTSKTDVKIGGRRSIESLAKSGAFDSISPSRAVAISSIEDILREAQKDTTSNDLFSDTKITFDPYEKYQNIKEISQNKALEFEKEAFGFYFTGHPIQINENFYSSYRSAQISDITEPRENAKIVGMINQLRQIKDKRGRNLMFISFDDGSGSMEGTIGSDLLQSHHEIFKKDKILIFVGNVDYDDFKSNQLNKTMYKMDVKNVELIDNTVNDLSKEILIDLTQFDADTLRIISEDANKTNGTFWEKNACTVKLKISSNQLTGIITLGENFTVTPSREKLDQLHDIFRTKNISIQSAL